jgi:RNA polymerase sigma factor (sigma-70 family)
MSGKIPKEREKYQLRLEEGRLYSVSREVYLCWYAGDRQERYQRERDAKNNVCSYEHLNELAFGEDSGSFGDVIPSQEESVEEQVIRKVFSEQLHRAIGRLEPEEQRLIQAIFFENVSMRAYAEKLGVTHRTIQKRQKRILQKLKDLILRN